MAKPVIDPTTLFPAFRQDCLEAFGEDLVSILLYGSAAGKHYRPGKSDINFLVVLSEEGIDRLDRAFPLIRKWGKRNVAVPLFLTEREVEASLDSFPVEYLNFRRNHVLVHGKDILDPLEFDPEMVRLQCEREVKGKLLILRKTFLETRGRATGIKEVIGPSLGAFIALFQALLHLRGLPIPDDRREVIRGAAGAMGLDASPFETLMDIKEDKRRVSDREMLRLFGEYLKTIRNLSNTVDEMGGQNE
jgi:predicted nucleotidyltransferase